MIGSSPLGHPPAPTAGHRHFVVAGIAAVVVFLAAGLWVGSGNRTDTDIGYGSAPPASASFSTTARRPTAFPATRFGLGFLALDEPVSRATSVLGRPTSIGPDVLRRAHTWALGGGAQLTVASTPDDQRITALAVQVPRGSAVRMAVFGGVVIGESTLQQLVDAWGPRYTTITSPLDDYAVSYVLCIGPHPIVVKADQPAATVRPAWTGPITSFLVAYADEAPGSNGCGTVNAGP